MEERQRVLIGLGAATAANCVPCFRHYYKKAKAVGLTREEIQECVDIGNRMKTGAMMAVKTNLEEIMVDRGLDEQSCGGPSSETSCCG